ncbi:MAG TPA: rod shape-determining protein MreD [Patescibacteria group bacterium]|nr:rod shape-determining protein MreD [Patescibacteria group bacterium]
MKPYLILILVFFLAILQGAFLRLNLVLLLVLAWAIFRPTKEVFLVAFFSGLLLDLAKGMPLGLSSLIFLVVVFLLSLYSRRFDSLYPLFLPVFVFFSSLVYRFIFSHYWFWFESLILALVALGARYLLVFLVGRIDRKQLRLQ